MSGKYIVVFKDHVSAQDIDKYANEVNANGGQVGHRYDSILKGFAASIPESYMQQFQSFAGDSVDYIEPDSVVTTQ